MGSPVAADLIENSQCVALAPLLYVAWADGELDAEEIATVRSRACTADIGDAQTAVIESWLNPTAPPSSTELLRLFRFIRLELGRLNAADRGSLVDVGLALANRQGADASGATQRALTEIESALGLTGSEVVRELFVPRPPVAQRFDEGTPPFSPTALTALLDADYAADWQAVRTLLQRAEFRAEIPFDDHHRYREQILGWLRILAEEGFGAVGFPESTGGAGRLDRFIEIFEALGMFDLSLVVKFGVQFGLFGGAILNLGTASHHRALLPALGKAELLGGFAMTELGHGSNVRDLETVARYDESRRVFVIHSPSPSARKEWIGNAACDGTTMVVFAQLVVDDESHGVHAFVVVVRDEEGRLAPGVSISDCGSKMGLNGVDNGRIAFDHVEVPRTALLNRYGDITEDGRYESPIASQSRRFFTMLGTLVGGRIGVGAASVSASKATLAIAIRYGALRRQFGPAGQQERCILDYPTHARRLFPRLAATYALHFAVRELKAEWRDHEGDDSRAIETFAAGLKSVATWHAIDTAQACRECCGGMGFLSLNRIAEIRKDVDVFATFEGDNTVLLQLVAKGLLTGYAKSFSSQFVGTLLREIGQRASAELYEKNPFAVRRTGDEHLRDPAFHDKAFAFRTHDLLRTAAGRIKKRTDAGEDAFDAMIAAQNHLVSLAVAHVEERVHAAFRRAVEAMAPGSERDALAHLSCLYAVWRLHDDSAWFLENNYVEPVKARALRKLFEQLCAETRPLALGLVDGFGIPDAVLAAPIAFEGYVESKALGASAG